MTVDRVRQAALAYVKAKLAKDAYYLDVSEGDEGWLARVIVVETRDRKGAEPKRWHVLYEIHLDRAFDALYHVRRSFWDKALPAGKTRPDVTAGDGGEGSDYVTTPQVSGEPEVPRVGTEGEPLRSEDERGEAPAGAEVRLDTSPEPAAAAPESAEKEAAESVPERMNGPAGGEEPADLSQENLPGEEGELDLGEELTQGEVVEETSAEVSGKAEVEPAEGVLTGAAAGDEATAGTEVIGTPETQAAPTPSEPGVSEKQGPPKVSLRFTLDDRIRRPGA